MRVHLNLCVCVCVGMCVCTHRFAAEIWTYEVMLEKERLLSPYANDVV